MFSNGKQIEGVTLSIDSAFGVNSKKITNNLVNVGEGKKTRRRVKGLIKRIERCLNLIW